MTRPPNLARPLIPGRSSTSGDLVPSPRQAAPATDLFRLIVENLPQSGVYLYDHDLRYVLAEGEALRAAGLAGLAGKRLQDVATGTSLAVLEQHYRAALRGEEQDFEHPGEDGSRWYRVRIRPLREGGTVVAGLVITDEVTQTRALTRELAQSRLRLQQQFDDAPVGMWLAEPGPDGAVLDVNSALCDLFGRTREDLLSRTTSFLWPSLTAAPHQALVELVRPNGSRRWMSMTGTVIDTVDGPRAMAHVLDVTTSRRAEAEVRRSHAFQETVLSTSPDIVSVFDLRSGLTSWASKKLEDILGYGLEHVRHLQGSSSPLHPDDVAPFAADMARVATSADGEVVHGSARVLHADGGWRVFARRSTVFQRDDHSQVTQVLNVSWDVTEQRAAAEELESTRAFQQAVIATTPDLILLLDTGSGRPMWSSRPLGELLGWSDDDLALLGDEPFLRLVHPSDAEGFLHLQREAAAAADDDVVHARYRARHRDGSWHWLLRRMTPFRRDEDGAVTQLLMIVRDVTDVMEAQRGLEHAALHDQLTGLPNRRLVADRLRNALAATARGGQLAVLFLDLDGFKRVNDAHGHAAGDAVLREVSARLSAAVRPGDTVGRMGGDEFVVLVRPQDEESLVALTRQVGDRLRREIARPVEHNGLTHSVTASIGVAYADVTGDADDLLRDADTAMYRAKTGGKDRLAVFDPDQHNDAVQRSSLERVLRRALAEERIEVHYQPIVRAGSGRLDGVEALLRVRGPEGDYLSTQDAVTVAEQIGLIGDLGSVVLRKACEQAVTWDDGLHVSVNLSAREVALPDLYGRISDVLLGTGLDPSRLVLELTETVLLEAARSTVLDLGRLRAAGVGIAIDDFGTGYASLRYLAALPVTCVKVDRSFTAGIGRDPVCGTLVQATIGLARDLGLDCVVEGVENERQLHAVGTEPHVLAQGYLLGRPAAAGLSARALLAPRT